jgi:hypothetical protein
MRRRSDPAPYARVKDEGFLLGGLYQLGQALHGLTDVDVRVAAVGEDPKLVPYPQVDAGRLDGVGIHRLDANPARSQLAAEAPMREDHVIDAKRGL